VALNCSGDDPTLVPEADCHARLFATFSSPLRQGMVRAEMRAKRDRAPFLGAPARKKHSRRKP
jgi:hypothetical protein